MSCHLLDCPFYDLSDAGCELSSYLIRYDEKAIKGEALLSASVEIGRILAARNLVSFSATGTCMYPCIKQKDTLFIEPCSIEDARVGDIAVIRRDGLLLGHRIISKGVETGKGTYIITRSDRRKHGNDGATFQNGMLGIVTRAERNGHIVQLDSRKMLVIDRIRISLLEWWNWRAMPIVARTTYIIQKRLAYRILAGALLYMRYPSPDISVFVPLKPRQKVDLFQVFSASVFRQDTVMQSGKPVSELTFQLSFQKKVPAARVTFVRRPDGCPDGDGWFAGRTWCRTRYRGAGLEDMLIKKAEEILGCVAVKFCRNT